MVKKRKVKNKVMNIKNNFKKSAPKEVKVLSILFYIFAVLSVISGLLMMLGGITGTALIGMLGVDQVMQLVPGLDLSQVIVGEIAFITIIFAGVIAILIGGVEWFIGRDLMKGKKWAYVVALILVIFGILNALMTFILNPFSAIISLIIYGILLYYLWFNKTVRNFFI
ncbi:MAG: hypothetical protein WC781_03245 [Candidatus Pacearchaeota archaeon]|jgi:hypothetical protein